MSKQIVIALGAGVLSAVLYALIFTGPLAGLPLFMAGLGLGVVGAGLAAIAATVLVGLYGASNAVHFALIYGAPAVLLVRQALLSRTRQDGSIEWYPAGLLIAMLSAYAAGLFLLAIALFGSQGPGLALSIRDSLVETLQWRVPTLPESERLAVAGTWSTWVPGMGASLWVVIVAVNAALAQGLLMRLGRNLRPSPQFHNLQVPTWLAIAVVATGAVGFAADGVVGLVARTLAILSALPFFFQGLTVVHALARGWSSRMVVLIAFYVLIVMLFPWSLLLVAGLGLAEQWLKMRQRFAGTGIVRKEE